MKLTKRATLLLAFALTATTTHAADGDLDWARRIGGPDPDISSAIAVDSAGNAYTTGHFYSTADFDPSPDTLNFTSAGRSDIFVQKLDANGNLLWARSTGGTGSDSGIGIAVDSAGNVYTTGYFSGTTDFDPSAGTLNLTSVGQSDIFMQKLDASGNLIWARSMGGTGSDSGIDVAVDSAGNVYTTGNFVSTVDFDPGAGTLKLSSSGGGDIFVQKLDANGNLSWARGMGGTSHDFAYGIAVDGAGYAYTTGDFAGTVDFDPGPGTVYLTAAGYSDIFIKKLDTNGNLVWARRMGGTNVFGDTGSSIALDSAGNIYTTGAFGGWVDFDPGAGTLGLTSAGDRDIFLQKLDVGGNLVWARCMGGTNWDDGNSIAVDGAGNVYSTGWFAGTVDFDPGAGTLSLTSAGEKDIYVQKLDASGNLVWARGMGGTGNSRGNSIAVDRAGNVYTTGDFAGTVDFDPGPGTLNLTSNRFFDIFVLKLSQLDYHFHSADQDSNHYISLMELLRVIQFHNEGGFHCANNPNDTEDDYLPGPGVNRDCAPHNTDYKPQDWVISLSELLRLIQFYDAGGYRYCPLESTEDDFCPIF